MSNREFYSCGRDCNECPEFEDCHNEDGEDCEYLKVVVEGEEEYSSPDSLLDQEVDEG